MKVLRSRVVVFRARKWYAALTAAGEAISSKHFYGDVITGLTPTKKQSETSQPIEKQSTKYQMNQP
jgi:hypothetical protein